MADAYEIAWTPARSDDGLILAGTSGSDVGRVAVIGSCGYQRVLLTELPICTKAR